MFPYYLIVHICSPKATPGALTHIYKPSLIHPVPAQSHLLLIDPPVPPGSPGLLSHTFPSEVVAHTSTESLLLPTLFWLQPGAFGRHCLLQFVPSGHLPFSQSFYRALSLVALSPSPSALSAALLFIFIFVKVPGALPPPLPTSSCLPARAVPGKQKFGCQTLPALSPTPTAVNPIGKQLRFCFPPHKKRVRPARGLRWPVLKHSWHSWRGRRSPSPSGRWPALALGFEHTAWSCWFAGPGAGLAPPEFSSDCLLWAHTGSDELTAVQKKERAETSARFRLLRGGRAKVVGAQQVDVSNTNAFLLLLDGGKCKQSNVLPYFLCLPLRR